MNWEAIGAVGEVLGAVGVIVTLAYLAVQIRANTRTMSAESRRAVRQSSREVNLRIAASSELARIFDEGLADSSKLDPTESTRFTFIFAEMISTCEELFIDSHSGIGESADFDQTARSTLPLLRAPGGREWWQRFGKNFTTEFQAYVNREYFSE